MNADDVVARYGLAPHPEGGHYRQTYRAPAEGGGRSVVTSIYYLLKAGELSHWHRVDAVEIWHFHAGDPLRLQMSADGSGITTLRLGLDSGAEPQVVVPAGMWQSARPEGAWTLVGCTVAPGFEFAGFELAPPDWRPAGK